MRRARVVLSTVVILFTLLAAAPAARAFPPPRAWQTRALQVAQYVWHPACGTITLSIDNPTGLTVLGIGPNMQPVDEPAADASGWAAIGQCEIHVNRDTDWLGYPDLCMTVLHEGGHAAGLGHSAKGIMSPYGSVALDMAWSKRLHRRFAIWQGVDARCMPRAFRPGGG